MLTDRIKHKIQQMIVIGCLPAMLLGFAVVAIAADLATITVRPKVSIENEQIFLGQIADIDTDDADLRHQLEACSVGRAPLPGKSRQINGDYLDIKLKQAGIDSNLIALHVPDKIEVVRPSQTFSKEMIEGVARRFLEARVPYDRKRFKVSRIQVNQEVVLPQGDITYQVAPPEQTDFVGTIPLAITFLCNGEYIRKIWVMATLEVLQEVIVTQKPIGRYQVIAADDIQVQTMDLAQLPSNILTTAEEVIGQRAKRTIDAQTVLSTSMIEAKPLVQRGDIVVMIAESGGLRISTKGEAREQGGKGERIKVMNIDSRKYVYALVVDRHTVKVDF